MIAEQGISGPVRRVLMTSGQYTGDGNDNRNIDIGYDLTNRHCYVMIKTSTGLNAVWRGYYHVGDVCSFHHDAADQSNLIQAFNSTGFQVGSGIYANQNGSLYRYVCFWLWP